MNELPNGGSPVMVDPEMPKLPEREKLQRLVNFMEFGAGPESPEPMTIGLPSTPPPPVVPEGIFDPDAAFTKARSGVDEGKYEWYTMPNGGRVCVHPVSPEDAMWLNRMALRAVRGAGLLKENTNEEMQRHQQLEASMAVTSHAQIYQVVCCCRVGTKITDKKVFRPEHAQMLRTIPGYLDAVQQIAAISDNLSAGKSDSAVMSEVMLDFFVGIGNWLEMLSSELTTDSLTYCKEILEDFGASVNSMTQHGKLNLEAIKAFRLLMSLPAPSLPAIDSSTTPTGMEIGPEEDDDLGS